MLVSVWVNMKIGDHRFVAIFQVTHVMFSSALNTSDSTASTEAIKSCKALSPAFRAIRMRDISFAYYGCFKLIFNSYFQ